MKSQMLLLLQQLLIELSGWCQHSATRDWKTITSRVENEGLSFLTITLPNFHTDFVRSLDEGCLVPNGFLGFTKNSAGLPDFLRGFLELIFDRGTGVLLEHPNIDAIFAVRQLTLLFKKVELPCSKEREEAAIRGYLECEQDLSSLDATGITLSRRFRVTFEMLFGNVLETVDRKVADQEVIPKHGSGNTADKLKGNQKFYQAEWTSRLESVFPWKLYLATSYELAESRLGHRIQILEPGQERPVKVTLVPKTLKTPRVIAMEPTCMMFMQQALMRELYGLLEKDDISSKLLGFTDQVPNQELAMKGSRDGTLATLDLSEASDRVSNLLVQNALHNYPSLSRAVAATRSTRADVLGHGIITLSKFASMGSALCFPIETMVFTTLVMMGIADGLNTQYLSPRALKGFKDQVRAYGDDIIVPVRFVHPVMRQLEAFGLKVNARKSFWTGKFRESCGKDYYDGRDITVIYCRQSIPTSRGKGKEMAAFVSLRNQLYKAGLWQTVRHIDSVIERLIPFPAVLDTSPVLGKTSFLGFETQKTHHGLQIPLVKGAVLRDRIPRNEVDDYGALLKWFLKQSELPFANENHLSFSGRPDTVGIMIRWTPAY